MDILILVACGIGIGLIALAGHIRRSSLRPRHAMTERDLSRLQPAGDDPPQPQPQHGSDDRSPVSPRS